MISPSKASVFARVEVALRPDLCDPRADHFLRQIELAYPEFRKKVRWARSVQVYWLNLECTREELIFAINEVFWDKTLQWLMTGNLIPSAGGKHGTAEDLLQFAPIRPGKFWGLERRFRAGVVDSVSRSVLEAFEVVLRRKLPESRAASGELIIVEGTQIRVEDLEFLARNLFCNDRLETWTIQEEEELLKNNRFHQERIKFDFPRLFVRPSLTSKITADAIGKCFKVSKTMMSSELPLLNWNDETVLTVSTRLRPEWTAIDPEGGSTRLMLAAASQVMGAGLGAKPISFFGGAAVGDPDQLSDPRELALPASRVIDQVRSGVARAGSVLGIPISTFNIHSSASYQKTPVVFGGCISKMPIQSFERQSSTKEIKTGDRLAIVGQPTVKDRGLNVMAAAQRSDALLLKRILDFILEARDLGLYRSLTEVDDRGLGAAISSMALLAGGLRLDSKQIPVGFPGMKWDEVLTSGSPERFIFAVPTIHAKAFEQLATARALNSAWVGEFQATGQIQWVAEDSHSFNLSDLLVESGVAPREGKKRDLPPIQNALSVPKMNDRTSVIIRNLISRRNLSSRTQWMKQWDREAQGTAVIQSLYGTGAPNDGFVIQISPSTLEGISVGTSLVGMGEASAEGFFHRAVDESIRNCLCHGGEFGLSNTVFSTQLSWLGSEVEWNQLQRTAKQWVSETSCSLTWGQSAHHEQLETLSAVTVSRIKDVRLARSSDFKNPGDVVYALGPMDLGLVGSEYQRAGQAMPENATAGSPHWDSAMKVYSWLGGSIGKYSHKLKSCHDVARGGVVIALVESLLGHSLGVQIDIPDEREPWSFCFGEGFHSFIVSISENDVSLLETEWAEGGVPFLKLGSVTATGKLRVNSAIEPGFIVPMESIHESWKNGGNWE